MLRRDEMWNVEHEDCKVKGAVRGLQSAKREVGSAGCEECRVKCEESVRLALHCAGAVCRSCSGTTTRQQVRTKHARMSLAGAREKD